MGSLIDCRDSYPGTSLRESSILISSVCPRSLPGFVSRHFIEGTSRKYTIELNKYCRDSYPGTSLRVLDDVADGKVEGYCRDSYPGTSLRGINHIASVAQQIQLPGFVSRHFIEGARMTWISSWRIDCRDSYPGTSLRGLVANQDASGAGLPGFVSRHFIEGCIMKYD